MPRKDLAHIFLDVDMFPEPKAHNMALHLVSDTLAQFGLDASTDFMLKPMAHVDEPRAATATERKFNALLAELSYDPDVQQNKYDEMGSLTEEQQDAFDAILVCLEAWVAGEPYAGPNVFYIDGQGGSGKTFLYTKLLRYVRARGGVALAVAMSGIAALLMEGGRTVHSRFRLPVPLPLDNASANVSMTSPTAKLLRKTQLLVWDEAPTAARSAFEAIDRCMRDVLRDVAGCNSGKAFGGMPVVLGGDFRQIPPVLKRVDVSEFAPHTLKSCDFWNQPGVVQRFRLTRNKRAEGDADCAAFLLEIGNGTYDGEQSLLQSPVPDPNNVPDGADPEPYRSHNAYSPQRNAEFPRPPDLHPAAVTLAAHLVAPQTWGIHELVDWAYPKLLSATNGSMQALTSYYQGRAVLSPTNAAADIVNEHILGLMPIPPRQYVSCDSILPARLLQSTSPSSFCMAWTLPGYHHIA